jgi:hypothetical protein
MKRAMKKLSTVRWIASAPVADNAAAQALVARAPKIDAVDLSRVTGGLRGNVVA